MVVDGNVDVHRSAARRFVSGQFEPATGGANEALPFKIDGDPRITRVGRFSASSRSTSCRSSGTSSWAT